MFGRRSDGRRLDHIDPIVQFMPYIMNKRNDATNYITEYLDYEPMADYIRRRSKEGVKITFMSLIMAAYVRAVAEHPALNRFIANKQVFGRNAITVSLTILKNGQNSNNLDEDLVKMSFRPDSTVEEVTSEIEQKVKTALETTDDGVASFAGKFIHFRLLVQLIVYTARLLDRYGLLPRFLNDLSPFHCSMFLTNIASINLPKMYHHIYNFGNTAMFIAMGKVEKQYRKTKDGIETKSVLPLSISVDERICGGAEMAQAFACFKRMIEHPELLEQRPERVLTDYDGQYRVKSR